MPQFEIELENGHKYQIDADTEEQAVFAAKGEDGGQTTATGAFARSAATGVLPAFGAAGGASVGAGIGTAILPGPGTVAGGLVGALAGSILTGAAQKKALQIAAPETAQRLAELEQADVEQHPVASFAGRIISPAAAFRAAPREAIRNLAAIPAALRAGASDEVKRMATKGATQAGLAVGTSTVMPMLPESLGGAGRLPTLGEVAEGTAQMMVYGQPRWKIRAPALPASEAEVAATPGPEREGIAPRFAQLKTPPDKITKPPKAGGVTPIDEYLAAQQKGVEDASSQPSAESVSESEVRPPMGEEAPLRQQGETAAPQAPEVQPQAEGGILRVKETDYASDPEWWKKIESATPEQKAKTVFDLARMPLGSWTKDMMWAAMEMRNNQAFQSQYPDAWRVLYDRINNEHRARDKASPTVMQTLDLDDSLQSLAKGVAPENPSPWMLPAPTPAPQEKPVYPLRFKNGGMVDAKGRPVDAQHNLITETPTSVQPDVRVETPSDLVPLYRGTDKAGYQGLKVTEGGVHGTGIYFYTDPTSARSHATTEGGVITGYAKPEDLEIHGNVAVLKDPSKFIARGKIPVEETVEGGQHWINRAKKALSEEPTSIPPKPPEAAPTAEAAASATEKPAAPPAEAASEKMEKTPTDPRLMSDQDIAKELDSITKSTDPLYDKLEKMGDAAFMPRSSKYTPDAQAIHDQITPFSRRKELLQFEKTRRENEIKNKAIFEARDKRVAEAPVYQRRNGWEIVKEGVDYVLRHPETKEDVYRGKLKRVREVADESKPEPQPPQEPLSPTQGAGPGTPSAAQGPDPKAQIEQLADAFKASKAPISERIKALVENSFNLGERLESAKDAVARALSGLKASGDALRKTLTSFTEPDAYSNALGYLSEALERRGWDTRMFVKAVKRAIPQTRRRNAIAKWVDAGGDRATLEEGLANTPDRYKQAYQDALNLSGDDLIHAQNIQGYFEARLKEAIDAGVVEHGLEDYIHRIYPRDTPIKRQMLAYVQSGILSKNPSLAKKRFFQYDWEAEQAGFNPVQDFLPRITDYETSLSKAIAAREFIAKMAQMKAPDGRPVVGIKGVGIPLTDAETGERTGTLIKPLGDLKKNANPEDAKNYRGDYVNREYNALSKWKWVAGDTEGKPILLKGDVAIHPAFVGRVDALLEPSKVRYGRYPRLGQSLLNIGSGFKQTMLDLSGFHHVQIALHAMEHRVMPWAINKEIDFSNPKVEGLLRGGVTLGGDYHTQREGLVGSSLTRQIPVLGPIMESYHSYLFQDLIPRIKMTMALHALERNRVRFAGDLASGKMSEKALYKLTADQANAAFGEQNYIMLERSKTSQDMLRLIFLAPDFLEARGKFVGQALTKYGTEQRVALALGALTMWTLARLLNKALNDQWHNEPENLFSVVHKNNSYSLRTVQGDVLHLLERPVQFWMSRLNPVYGRTAMELATGRDWFGRKRSMPEQAWDAASNIVPISLRSSRERTMWESMLNAFGVTARRYNDVDDAFKLAQKWKAAHGVQERGEFIYDPDKDPLRALKIALVRQDEAGAAKEIQRLLQSKATTIGKLNAYFNRYASMPFTGSRAHDRQWKATLSEDERKTVESGRQTKERIRKLYRLARNQYLAALITANSTP